MDVTDSEWILAIANEFSRQRMNFTDSEWILAIPNEF